MALRQKAINWPAPGTTVAPDTNVFAQNIHTRNDIPSSDLIQILLSDSSTMSLFIVFNGIIREFELNEGAAFLTLQHGATLHPGMTYNLQHQNIAPIEVAVTIYTTVVE